VHTLLHLEINFQCGIFKSVTINHRDGSVRFELLIMFCVLIKIEFKNFQIQYNVEFIPTPINSLRAIIRQILEKIVLETSERAV
jgi:hypothetical protein